MITVTERAKEALLRLRLSAGIDEADVGMRLEPGVGGRLELFADRVQAGDQVVEHRGCKVLLVSAALCEALAGTEVDCRETSEGAVELVMARPKKDRGGQERRRRRRP